MYGNNSNEMDISASYLGQLVLLTANSKQLINMLTILAQENIAYGHIVVNTIANHLSKVDPALKLPILYLIDSIIKNVGGVYVQYFSHSIVKIFTSAFEQVNEEIQRKMLALRQTWNGIFPPEKLYKLDNKIDQLHPHWRIFAQTIHVNPSFLAATTEVEMKERELLELRRRKVEFIVAATQRQLAVAPPEVTPVQPHSPIPNPLPNNNQINNMPNPHYQQSTFGSNPNPPIMNDVRDPRLFRPKFYPPVGRNARINNPNFAPNPNRGRSVHAPPYNDINRVHEINRKMMHQHSTNNLPYKPKFSSFKGERGPWPNSASSSHKRLKRRSDDRLQQSFEDVGPNDNEFRSRRSPNMNFNQKTQNIQKPQNLDFNSNEPKIKKNKSEKIDTLFGKEDVDLRILPEVSGIPLCGIVQPSDNVSQIKRYEHVEMPHFYHTPPPDNFSADSAYFGTDLQSNLMSPLCQLQPFTSTVPNRNTVKTEVNQSAVINQTCTSMNLSPTMNVNDLFQKLLTSGIINSPMIEKNDDKNVLTKIKTEIGPLVDLKRPETLKKRHSSIIDALYLGTQCGNCGIRFAVEETTKYSQHLDWHFRANHRLNDSIHKTITPKLYLPLAEWLQYQEIDNGDESGKNWFEMEAANGKCSELFALQSPSCVSSPCDTNKTCDMCHDPFEIFHNEETDEWHWRNAIRFQDNIYHPDCHADYMASLASDDTKKQDELSKTMDDDDVIILPQPKPDIVHIPDDDGNDQTVKETSMDVANELPDSNGAVLIGSCDTGFSSLPENDDNDDLQILEKNIPTLNLDEYVETNEKCEETDMMPAIKIKQEPKYHGYGDDIDDGFEDVGTLECHVGDTQINVEDQASVSSNNEQPICNTTPESFNADGVSGGKNKIKINISNNVQLNIDSINSSPITNKQSTNTEINATNKNVIENENGENHSSEIKYDIKDSLKQIQFERQPTVFGGLESSNLCSIM